MAGLICRCSVWKAGYTVGAWLNCASSVIDSCMMVQPDSLESECAIRMSLCLWSMLSLAADYFSLQCFPAYWAEATLWTSLFSCGATCLSLSLSLSPALFWMVSMVIAVHSRNGAGLNSHHLTINHLNVHTCTQGARFFMLTHLSRS